MIESIRIGPNDEWSSFYSPPKAEPPVADWDAYCVIWRWTSGGDEYKWHVWLTEYVGGLGGQSAPKLFQYKQEAQEFSSELVKAREGSVEAKVVNATLSLKSPD